MRKFVIYLVLIVFGLFLVSCDSLCDECIDINKDYICDECGGSIGRTAPIIDSYFKVEVTGSKDSLVENLKSLYKVGEKVEINVLSNCDSIKVTAPNGDVTYLDVSNEITSFKPTLVGTYVLSMNFNGEIKEFSIYSNLPLEESDTQFEVLDINLSGELENEYSDGIYDKLVVLFIILAIVFVADWVVYCREQYQLR